jgi:hypothetical protein
MPGTAKGIEMAKVQFFLNNGASIHSLRKSGELDTVKDLGLDEGEWEEMSEDDKYKQAEDWAADKIEIYFEEA